MLKQKDVKKKSHEPLFDEDISKIQNHNEHIRKAQENLLAKQSKKVVAVNNILGGLLSIDLITILALVERNQMEIVKKLLYVGLVLANVYIFNMVDLFVRKLCRKFKTKVIKEIVEEVKKQEQLIY